MKKTCDCGETAFRKLHSSWVCHRCFAMRLVNAETAPKYKGVQMTDLPKHVYRDIENSFRKFFRVRGMKATVDHAGFVERPI